MTEEPDLNFDIDALFEHLSNDFERDGEEQLDWSFSFRSSQVPVLQQIADELEDEFRLHLQDSVDEIDVDGNVTSGDPMLVAVARGDFTVDEIKAFAEQMRSIAEAKGVRYEGVECYDAIDEEELFGWMEFDDAVWRLRHMTDIGVAEDEEMPWAFLVVAPTFERINAIAQACSAEGFGDHDEYDEPDEEGEFGMCVFVEGRNNESELAKTASRISELADSFEGCLAGIQFYTREDVEAVFGEDDDWDPETGESV